MRTVVEAARSAIHARNLNEKLWAEAVFYSVFTLNQTGTSSVKGKSPAELWFGRTMDIRTLRSFGCDCYVLIPARYRTTSGKKSKKGILVGYDIDSASYRIYFSNTNEVVSSENVIFDENSDADESMYVEIGNTMQKEHNKNERLSNSGDDSSSYEFISSEESGGEENEQP
uniref:Retroviral polymerase SH3-like domain-containing protein n=1 Tax=Clastoptera arizonana TaxID=38151 RepID=A0A1B6DZF0_9HEMI